MGGVNRGGSMVQCIDQRWETGDGIHVSIYGDGQLAIAVFDDMRGECVWEADNFPPAFLTHLKMLLDGHVHAVGELDQTLSCDGGCDGQADVSQRFGCCGGCSCDRPSGGLHDV